MSVLDSYEREVGTEVFSRHINAAVTFAVVRILQREAALHLPKPEDGIVRVIEGSVVPQKRVPAPPEPSVPNPVVHEKPSPKVSGSELFFAAIAAFGFALALGRQRNSR